MLPCTYTTSTGTISASALAPWPVELGNEIGVQGHPWPVEVIDLA